MTRQCHLEPLYFLSVILSPFMGRQDLIGIVVVVLKSDSRPCNKDIDGAFACAHPLNMTIPRNKKNPSFPADFFQFLNFYSKRCGICASALSFATNSSNGITSCFSLPKRRTVTVRFSFSLAPTTAITGIFAKECSRIL